MSAVSSQFRISYRYLLIDFVNVYYTIVKRQVAEFKNTIEYYDRKQLLISIFVSAYMSALKGDTVFVD